MPDSFELLIGVKGKAKIYRELKKFPQMHTLPSTLDDLLYDEGFEDWGVLCDPDEKLYEAHKAACVEMGFKHLKDDDTLVQYQTPLGIRDIMPFRFDLFYDPDEIGDDDTTAAFGIALSSRYFPTFVDWEARSGALYHWVMDNRAMETMAIARRNIAEFFPQIKDWNYIFQSRFY